MLIPDENNHKFLHALEIGLARVFTPPPKVLPSDWVEEHRSISPEANAKRSGRWRNLCLQVDPINSIVDPSVRTLVMQWASQTAGKTEVVNAICGYFIAQEPSPILVVQPDLILAKTWSKDRLMTMVRDTPVLKDLVKKRGSSTLHKVFPAGHLTIAGANSPASLASRPIRVNLFDEVDRFPASAGKEGDPVLLALKRSDTFPDAMAVMTSTPTIKRKSRIEAEFLLSDQNYWFCVCPTCSHEQRLHWKQLKFNSDDLNDPIYYECENEECKAQWDDRTRIAAIKAGRWIATAPYNGIRGYHLSGLYSLFRAKKGFRCRLHQMAAEFLHAVKLGKDALKVWTNTFLAETWEEEIDAKPEWKALYDRREDYHDQAIPQGVRVITVGTDFQADRIELEFVGHGVGEESWGLGHHVLYGDTRNPEIYQRLEAVLLKRFKRVDGAYLQVKAGGFDTGYAACQRQLYAWLRPRLVRRYFAFKGANRKNAEPISMSAKSKVEAVRLIMVGTNRIKTFIYSRTSISVPGPGFMHFPKSYTDEWFKQLLAEESRNEFEAGQSFKVFSMPTSIPDGGTDRNEALDCRVYAYGALYASGTVNWEHEERLNLKTIEENAQQRPMKPKKRRSSLLAGLQLPA